MIPHHPRYNKEQLEPGRDPVGRVVLVGTALVLVVLAVIHPALASLFLIVGGCITPVCLLAWHVAIICREDAEIARARKAERASQRHEEDESMPS